MRNTSGWSLWAAWAPSTLPCRAVAPPSSACQRAPIFPTPSTGETRDTSLMWRIRKTAAPAGPSVLYVWPYICPVALSVLQDICSCSCRKQLPLQYNKKLSGFLYLSDRLSGGPELQEDEQAGASERAAVGWLLQGLWQHGLRRRSDGSGLSLHQSHWRDWHRGVVPLWSSGKQRALWLKEYCQRGCKNIVYKRGHPKSRHSASKGTKRWKWSLSLGQKIWFYKWGSAIVTSCGDTASLT